MASSFSSSKVKTIIVGAGVCGLLTAIQLERAGMDYVVVEKARTSSPLGSGLSLTPACNYILDQLGLLKEIQQVSYPCAKIDYLRDDLSKVGVMDAGDQISRYGYNGILINRHSLYKVLLSKVPKHKIQWGKRLVNQKQDEHGVEIECEDNLNLPEDADESANNTDNRAKVVYKGDVLIGADGAYSSVRRYMYQSMSAEGIKLPLEDLAPLRFDSNCVVGVTKELSDVEYPVLKEKNGDFYVLIGKEKAIQVYLFTFAEKRIGWYICGRMDKPEVHDEKDFRFSDWKPVAADELCEMVRHYKCPFGGTVGDLMDLTPKDLLSKVMLEDKYFSTWYHKRTVLMGDACHKHLPFGGQGANQAILDSVHLVNQLYGIPSNSLADINLSFKTYYENRSPNAKDVFTSTSMVASVLSARGLISDFVRFLLLGHLPAVINNAGMDDSSRRQQFPFFGAGQGCAHRPQQKQSQQELPLEPIHDDPIARVFTPQRQTLQLQHILAHGAPYSKSAKVFRRLDIDDETRFQMTFHRNSLLDTEADGTKSGSGSTFQHTLSDAYFPLHDEDDGDGNVVTEPSAESRSGLLPRLPWTRVPDAKDHGTVVSMIRMALDCYVDPKRQGWVDIGDNWDVDTEIGWLEAGLRGYVFASEDKKTVVIGIKGTSLKLFGT
ncbi:hypothetical protein BGZ98_007950, partial [Dissophora globulifera]